MNEPMIATKNDLTDEDFQHMDKLDEEQILAELTGEHITKYVYDFTRAKKRILGITYAGIKKWSEHQPIDLDIYRWNETEEYISVIMVAKHLELGIKRFGTATVPKNNEDGSGQSRRDWFAETKVTSKAQRNALKQFMDEPTMAAMIDAYLADKQSPWKPQPAQVPQLKSETSVDHKAYADAVSEKAVWRKRCFDVAKHIAQKHEVDYGQDAFEAAFKQYENVDIEEAHVERLTEWLAYLSSPKGSQYIVDFCRNFYAKLDQKEAQESAEIQKADWLEKCLYKARTFGFDAALHNKAYALRSGREIGDATVEQLDVWYTFLDTFGEEYLQRIAADDKTSSKASSPVHQELPQQLDITQLLRLCASIRMLWAKLPSYGNLQHKVSSIKQHIGDYQPSELSQCKDISKLQAYESYLKGQLPTA